MKNILLFVFGALTMAFVATTFMLYTDPNENIFANMISSLSGVTKKIPDKKNFSGQIFIVTRGGDSVPLGGVIVGFYTQDQFLNYIRNMYTSIGAEVARLVPKFQKKRNEETEARYAWVKLDKASLDARVKAADIWKQKERERKAVYYELLHKTDAATFASALPPPSITTQTDASGKFSIALSTEEPLTAAACASRQIGKQTENYCWFTSMDGSREILMNNHNMLGMQSADSVFSVPILPMDCDNDLECFYHVNDMEIAYFRFFPEPMKQGSSK